MQLQFFLPQGRAQNIKKGHRPRMTDDPEEGPKASKLQEAPGARQWLQLLPPFLYSPGGKQSEPLPDIKAGQRFIASEVSPQLADEDLPCQMNELELQLVLRMNFKIVSKFADIHGYSRRKSGITRRLLTSTAHCCNSVISSAVKNPIKLGASPCCGYGDSSTGNGEGRDGDGDSGLSATPATTSKGILTGRDATTPTTTSSCSISTSLSEFSSKCPSYWSILQQQRFTLRSYDPCSYPDSSLQWFSDISY